MIQVFLSPHFSISGDPICISRLKQYIFEVPFWTRTLPLYPIFIPPMGSHQTLHILFLWSLFHNMTPLFPFLYACLLSEDDNNLRKETMPHLALNLEYQGLVYCRCSVYMSFPCEDTEYQGPALAEMTRRSYR